MLALTTIPAVIMGAVFHHFIKTYLFGPLTVAGALGVGGVAILLAEKFKPVPKIFKIDDLSYSHAIKIGLIQCIALWPGVSRSASTILGGLFCGLDRKVAAEYSFVAAVPILTAAAVYDLYKNWDLFNNVDWPFFLVGLAVSFVCACLAIKTFMALLKTWTFVPFGWYRIIIAPIIFWFMM